MERRRMMMGGGGAKLIEDGLLLWYDGLNMGSTANEWWPYVNNTAYNNLYFAKVGTVNNKDDGMQIPWDATYSKGGLVDRNNPLKALSGNNMTVIVVASEMQRPSIDVGIVEFAKWKGDYSGRMALLANASYNVLHNKGYGSSWHISTIPVPVTINKAVVAFTSNGSNGTCIADIDGTKYKDAGFYPFKKDVSNGMCMIVGAYDYYPGVNSANLPGGRRSSSNWKDWSGIYHAVLLYNRVLSDSEIAQVTDWLKKRYD